MVGEEGEVVVSIINREHDKANYRVEVGIDGVITNKVGPVTLEHDEEWEAMVGFTPNKAGDKQQAEFLLYRQEQEEAYRRLHFWLDVQ